MSVIRDVFAPPPIENARSALCIQPHPDDNEIGMGGTVAKLVDNGCKVSYLTVTNGDYGSPSSDISREQIAVIRRAETEEAGRHLGVEDFHYLPHSDCSLNDEITLAKEIARVIKTVKPEVVFCPDPFAKYESHSDHLIVGRATAQAFCLSGLCGYPDDGGEAHAARALAFYYTQDSNTRVSVTRYFERKMEAIALHKSQITPETLSLYRTFFKLVGLRLGVFRFKGIAEGFKVLSPLHLHCFPFSHKI